MKHSIPWIVFCTGCAVMLACQQANATAGDSPAQAGATAAPALAASSSSDSGRATEDASRANEQQLLGLPRVPKDTNPGVAGDDGTASTTRVALRRPTSTRVVSTAKRVEVFANPYPASIYPAGADNAVYKSPW
ncbi:hypothetical protein [Paraburkholderia eburnea]|nr:hypothetical protein [Paraburkholderia eburnea]